MYNTLEVQAERQPCVYLRVSVVAKQESRQARGLFGDSNSEECIEPGKRDELKERARKSHNRYIILSRWEVCQPSIASLLPHAEIQ